MKFHYWLFWMLFFIMLILFGGTSILCYTKKKYIYARASKSIRDGTKYNKVPPIDRIKLSYVVNNEKIFPSHVNPNRIPISPDIVNEMINEDLRVAFSNVIEVSDLKEYVQNSLENGTLATEHESLQDSSSPSWSCEVSKANKEKNRYKNIDAYDYNRVILRNMFGTRSDYINASYIDGFEVPKAYIATQGPTKNTIDDFWLMIWQQNVHHIVMIANLEENGKENVSKYWPGQDESITYDYYNTLIKVDNVWIHKSLNYVKRQFLVTCKTEQRKVTQYQFTNWPDHTVPSSTNSLIEFMGELQTIALSTFSPVVVHCSAGTGRTGTIILCDINLRRAAKAKTVDFKNVLHNLRQERPSMVGMVEQYIFAHRLVADYLTTIGTAVRLS